MNPYLIQSDFATLILAMQQRIAGVNALLSSPILMAALAQFSDLQAEFQAAVGTTAVGQYTTLLTKLQAMEPLAPIS
jgi:hypothetical protein